MTYAQSGQPKESFAPYDQPVNFTNNWEKEGTLYFVRNGQFLKVGITRSVERRIASFKVGNPNRVFLSAARHIPWAIARQIEKRVHLALWEFHHEGEWFDIKTRDAIRIADPIIRHAWDDVERLRDDCEDAWIAAREHDERLKQRERNIRMNGAGSNVVELNPFKRKCR
jgi:hypothetical protein